VNAAINPIVTINGVMTPVPTIPSPGTAPAGGADQDWLAGQLSAMGLTPSEALNQPPSALASTDRPRRHPVGQKSGYVVRHLIPPPGAVWQPVVGSHTGSLDLDRAVHPLAAAVPAESTVRIKDPFSHVERQGAPDRYANTRPRGYDRRMGSCNSSRKTVCGIGQYSRGVLEAVHILSASA
jgi:hypothetical protein